MSRPDGRIEKGQRLTSAISARAWNRAQDAADVVLGVTPGMMAGQSVPIEKASNIVLVRNESGHAIPVGGVVRIGEAAFDNSLLTDGTYDGDNAASSAVRGMSSRQAYVGLLPTVDDPVGIALEPIAINSVGRAAIRGTVYFKLRVISTLHRYAAPLAGDWTQLKSAGCGPVKILAADARLGDGRNAWGVM